VIVYERPVRFEEVDAARIVFMGRFVGYAHEAMEVFFDALDGGYARLINERGIGLPAVHIEMKFSKPARYGDVLRIETSTTRIGNRSAVLRYVMRKANETDVVAELDHTIVTTDLANARSMDMPADVRAVLTQHLRSDAGP
jgi:4-hydroxybenzoyl-CoA thioesterase